MELKEALKSVEEAAESVDYAIEQYNKAKEKVGNVLREKRTTAGVSLREFGITIGKSATFIWDMESGRRYPSSKTMQKIKETLLEKKLQPRSLPVKSTDKE